MPYTCMHTYIHTHMHACMHEHNQLTVSYSLHCAMLLSLHARTMPRCDGAHTGNWDHRESLSRETPAHTLPSVYQSSAYACMRTWVHARFRQTSKSKKHGQSRNVPFKRGEDGVDVFWVQMPQLSSVLMASYTILSGAHTGGNLTIMYVWIYVCMYVCMYVCSICHVSWA